MFGPTMITKPFDSYVVTYAITNADGKDYIRIDYLSNGVQVGQMLFGSAVVPGTYATLQGELIMLYFPLEHFQNITHLLQHQQNLSLYVQADETLGPAGVMLGGITTQQ